jgi:hypothetical protein
VSGARPSGLGFRRSDPTTPSQGPCPHAGQARSLLSPSRPKTSPVSTQAEAVHLSTTQARPGTGPPHRPRPGPCCSCAGRGQVIEPTQSKPGPCSHIGQSLVPVVPCAGQAGPLSPHRPRLCHCCPHADQASSLLSPRRPRPSR